MFNVLQKNLHIATWRLNAETSKFLTFGSSHSKTEKVISVETSWYQSQSWAHFVLRLNKFCLNKRIFEMLTLIFAFLLAVLLYLSTRKPKNFPPGPPRLPILGSLPFMTGSGPSPSLLHGIIDQVKKHGPIFGFYFGKTPAVVIADYHLVSHSKAGLNLLVPS